MERLLKKRTLCCWMLTELIYNDMLKVVVCVLLLIFLFVCSCSKRKEIVTILNEWQGREVVFPLDVYSYVGTNDTVLFPLQSNFRIVTYVDSSGCTNCKLHLEGWKKFIPQLESLCFDDVDILFFIHSKDPRNDKFLFKRFNFNYPICLDTNDVFNQLNKFPKSDAFHTFLLDKDNKVLAIGNPVLNPKVKDLYLKIIQGKPVGEEEERERVETTVSVSSSILSMGEFPYREASSGSFTFTNTGKELWVIQDVVTSCGCLTVEYPKEPVRPGGQAVLRVTYRADNPGYFDKTLTVYSNAADSPLRLRVTGSAVE